MFITDEEVNERLSHDRNALNRFSNVKKRLIVVPKDKREGNSGRNLGDTNLNPMMREIVGTAAHFDKLKNVAKAFDVSMSTVANSKVGNVGPIRKDEDLRDKISKNLEVARDKALDKLMDALGLMNPEKMENANLSVLSKVAADMARVVEKTNPLKDTTIDNSTKILVYRPRQNSEDDYEIIDAPFVEQVG